MAGKKWTPQQETELRALVEANTDIQELATKFQRTPGAIMKKCERLGMSLKPKGIVKSPIYLPRDLPSVEEALRMLAGALKGSLKPGLDKVEVQRLQAVATISKTYKELLVDYINYREIETQLKEMKELNAQLLRERSPSLPPQPNPT
ncbi:MAG TPA: hypothetical protein VLH35_07020 [Candidatus Acidoferrales bacterium]|nr:hypothetical protein [Candidatus Acidoferrales bacterium]